MLIYYVFFRGCAGPARAAANGDGWDEEPPSARAISHNAGAWAKFGRPEKRSRFSRALEFGRARMAERATGRSSRGRDPEEPPRSGGDERPRAC